MYHISRCHIIRHIRGGIGCLSKKGVGTALDIRQKALIEGFWAWESINWLMSVSRISVRQATYFRLRFFGAGNGWPPIFWILSSRRPNCSPRVGNFAPIEAGARGFFVINNFLTKLAYLGELVQLALCSWWRSVNRCKDVGWRSSKQFRRVG